MNIDEIRALAAIVKENGLESLQVTEGELSVLLQMPKAAAPCAPTAPVPSAAPAAGVAPAEGAANSTGKEILSPMVGMFYAAPSPDSQPFVRPGDAVKKGDVLCIIEAMKLMNEITAEEDGVIAEVLVDNGQVVEFSQPLFRLQ